MKRQLTFIIVVVLLLGGWFAYRIFTGKVKRLTETDAATRVTAADLLAIFEKDSAAANHQFLGKVLEVSGPVKAVEKEEGSATVVLGEAGALSSVRCSMDSAFVKIAAGLNPGSTAVIKGVCTGYHPDDMGLGADAVLNRCIIIDPNKKK